MTNWISIRDKLPKEGELVKIATISDEAVFYTEGGQGIIWFKKTSPVQAMYVHQPTHWAPADEEKE